MKDHDLYRFGPYVLDAKRMVLRGEQGVVGLPPKALATLLALVEQQGEVVSKQELMQKVWPESYVEEGNLSQNIFLLRRELGRSPEGADYIQTLSKRGYRINVPVERMSDSAPSGLTSTSAELAAATERPVQTQVPSVPQRLLPRRKSLAWPIVSLLALGLGLGILWREQMVMPRVSDFTQLTHDGAVKRGHHPSAAGPDAALFTDGARIYFTEGTSDSLSLAQVSASGGDTTEIPTPIPEPQMLDLSRSRSKLLVSGQSDSATPATLWSVPIPAGAPREMSNTHGWDAAWSPDGLSLALTAGRELSLAAADGADARKIATLPGSAWMPRWSPDGRRIRLTVYNIQASGYSLWEVRSDGSGLHQILSELATKGDPVSVCCGSWTPDGRYFVFEVTRAGKSEIWTVAERPKWLDLLPWPLAKPTQLTSGQLSSLAPVLSPDGRKLYVVGQQLRGELERFDPSTRQFVSYLGGKSMDFLSFSRDGRWITWIEYPERTLWRSRADGSERLQLTFAPLHAMMPRWSPDDKTIVFYAGGGGGNQRAYLISAHGGQPTPLGGAKEMLPNWSPDGGSIVYSEFPFFAADPLRVAIHIFHLKTHQTETLPDSEGLFAAQWSPDGRYIAAITLQGSTIKLFDLATRTWSELGKGSGFLNWSHNSKDLYCLRNGANPAVVRFRVSDRQGQEVASLNGVRESGQLAGLWFGLNPDEEPYILRDIGTQEIYSLAWHDR